MVDLAGDEAERSRSVNRDEGFGVQDERLQYLKCATQQHLVDHLRHAFGTDLEAARCQNATAQRTCRRACYEGFERTFRIEDPSADFRNLDRERAGGPDEDLHAGA